ncbi:MAG: 23S rRNA (adenine(2503)-C(2))-methyltransferase RlmN [Acidobacteria bacterium]|nr:23S rRNA (adenine(2503)-C(2))-methyltransferase RlmN [Acidobacteriota bacterium]
MPASPDTDRTPLVGRTRDEIVALAVELGEPPFRGRQLHDAVYRRRVLDPAAMTDLPKALREKLAADFPVTETAIRTVFRSQDGTRRYLLSLADGETIESVFIPVASRDTICISSQVGCAVGCTFCMTAKVTVRRQMTASEIASQVLVVLNDVYGPGGEIPHGTNVVYMGMGEPFLNYDEVMKSVRLLASPEGMNVSHRRMTVSTSGIVPRIMDFGLESVRPELAVSLTAPVDSLRDELIPINRKYPIADLMEACRSFPLGPRERLTFEYVMLDGVNDSDAMARLVAGLLGGMRAKVNLIPHNPAPELPYAASPMDRIESFQRALVGRGVDAYIRRPRGRDISAACGQLAARPNAQA